jgi:hypothetical protein
MPVKIQLEDVLKELEHKNYELLNVKEFKNTNSKGEFLCKIHNIKWNCGIRYVLKDIQYCSDCKKNKPIYTLDEILLLNGFKLNKKLKNGYGEFECMYGHIWKTQINHIKSLSSGCSECFRPKITLNMIKDKIRQKNYILLNEEEFKNTREDGTFQCKYNHTWSTCIYNVYAERSGCPICSMPLCEKMCMFILNKLFNNNFYKTRNVLPSKLELDGYCKELKIAFEYNGIVHYVEHPNFFHKNGSLESQIKRDEQKVKECAELGITLIIIPYQYNTFMIIKDYIISELHKFQHLDNLYNENLDWENLKLEYYQTWEFLDDNPEEFIEIKKIIEKQNGKCLSDKYINTKRKLRIKCSNEEHPIFEMNSNDLKRGRWCPKCGKCALKKTKESINEYLKPFNFKLLDEYINSSTKYSFSCNNNHIINCTWNNIKGYAIKGCKECK